jgi:hypothetical protein
MDVSVGGGSVGGMDVLVGGGSVGGMDVSVGGGSVGGMDVSVGGGSVGGMGVFVGGMRVFVAVGRLVLVKVGTGVRVRVGSCGTGVRLAMKARVGASRVFLGGEGVIVTKRLGVFVSDGTELKVGVAVGCRVAVGTNTVTTCSVKAPAVSRFDTARLTRSMGRIGITRFKSPMARADTLHSRLSPMAPAARMPRGPE